MRTPHIIIPALFILLGAAACTRKTDETPRVNGSIHLAAGQQNGDAATATGDISVDDHATFGSASTVTGDIWVGAGARGISAKAVNGKITLDKGAKLSGEMSSVDGRLTLNEGAEAGSVSNVNGTITLNDATVDQDVATVNADILVNGHSRILGGIHVHKLPIGVLQGAKEPAHIIIGPGATVQGAMKFDRPVKLYVSDKASVGAIDGASPTAFSGDTPSS